ncbi:Pentalenene oxygenase [Anatilimnocola aggregata]|uniref:Pentalenene oxygenase n=1 Tax=Anatilimnocola aggregata TaxID=2528021 RepID=A0A517YIL8_9BACT|nr:cytochrome P450 [Anatilimnocola aggregata]QDU30068.1 Pentalenene oxygenase [Anatilimnocola aggregata]
MATVERLPGPRGNWLLGSLPAIRQDMLGFFETCQREYGDAAYFRVGQRRSMLLSHPDDIEQVLVTDNKKFIKNFALSFFLRPLLGNGLLINEGQDWLRQRRLIQPTFARPRLEHYSQAMVDLTQRMLSTWQNGDERDLAREMMQLTMAIAGKTLLGVDVGGRYQQVVECLESVMRDFLARFRSPLPIPYWFPTFGNWRLKRTIRRLDAVLQQMIDERRTAIEGQGEIPGDFLSLLITARDETDGKPLSNQQLRDEVMTMFLAGHETTANALSWTWYLLGQHPEEQQRVRQEVDNVLAGRVPTPADVPRLMHCERVIKEAMRLYPPAYVVGRRCEEDCTIGEHFIPAMTNVLMCQWLVHRDERWFDEPAEFIPNRWTSEFSHSLPKYAYFPFGGGPRACIGNHFAMLEGVLVLALMAQRVELELIDREPLPIMPAITLRPGKPVDMRVQLRA